jgi:hypothetical protein
MFRATSNILVPSTIKVVSLPTSYFEEQSRRIHVLKLRRPGTFARGSPLSKLGGVLPLTFHLAKVYYLNWHFSLNYVSELFDPEFLVWSQAWKVLSYFEMVLSFAIVGAVFSPSGPVSLRRSSDQLSNHPDSGNINWRIYLYHRSDILVERKVAQPIISDIIQTFLQSCTNKPIIWWPLEGPLLPLSSGKVRISWLSVSGVNFPIAIFDD